MNDVVFVGSIILQAVLLGNMVGWFIRIVILRYNLGKWVNLVRPVSIVAGVGSAWMNIWPAPDRVDSYKIRIISFGFRIVGTIVFLFAICMHFMLDVFSILYFSKAFAESLRTYQITHRLQRDFRLMQRGKLPREAFVSEEAYQQHLQRANELKKKGKQK